MGHLIQEVTPVKSHYRSRLRSSNMLHFSLHEAKEEDLFLDAFSSPYPKPPAPTDAARPVQHQPQHWLSE